ncbi:hypothetical protein B0H15DRAFT_956538 [Mycena belliarum]|uniref:AB hydrolase-1 domain-containing protein n=1 Tax=Mycena belliarum TaxID=1033014 RepID=A0AAD6TUB2_9AGAR|nr:hypothetical protein B0H15DRAFT_956538 [Mycena belliae]
MPSKHLKSSGIPGTNVEFTYTDSGLPNGAHSYTTLILVHGHTFHAGVFRKLQLLAAAEGSARIICINRREYEGSTIYSPPERAVFKDKNQGSATDAQRLALLETEGLHLAYCISNIIEQCALPADVALVGWSLGNTFTRAAMVSITSDLLEEDRKKILGAHVTLFILWDPPSHALGIESPPPPHGYVPLLDKDLAPEQRGLVFGTWVASFFEHPAYKTKPAVHKADQLLYRIEEAKKPPTFHDTPLPELLALTNFAVGGISDTAITEPCFIPAVQEIIDRALFDTATREAWTLGGERAAVKVAYICTEASSWNIPWAMWDIQHRIEKANDKELSIAFYSIPNANHFFMWEDPKRALASLMECIKVRVGTT